MEASEQGIISSIIIMIRIIIYQVMREPEGHVRCVSLLHVMGALKILIHEAPSSGTKGLNRVELTLCAQSKDR